MIRRAVSALVLVALIASAALAAEKMTVYVRNKPFKGKTMFRSGRLYLPLKALAASLDLVVTQQGKTWCVTDKAHEGAKCPGETASLCVNGTAVADAAIDSGGETWVAAQPVMKALGGVYLENKSLGMIDIGLKYVAPPKSALDPRPGGDAVASGAKPIMVHWFANW